MDPSGSSNGSIPINKDETNRITHIIIIFNKNNLPFKCSKFYRNNLRNFTKVLIKMNKYNKPKKPNGSSMDMAHMLCSFEILFDSVLKFNIFEKVFLKL